MAYPAAPALHHNPLTVWRVENAAGEGPYDSEAATGVGPKGSAPVVDFGVRPEDTKKWWASHRGWRFGFAHKEDAVAWFGAARLKKLAEKGYRLVKKDAALIEPSTSDMQVFYLPVEKKLSGKENMLALGQGVTAEAEAEGWQRPYSRFMAAWAVADACRDDKDSWPYPKGLLSRYLKELAEFQRPGETWRQAWDRYAKPSWCKRRGYRRNPSPTKTLYRAAHDETVTAGTCFAEDIDDAIEYQDNSGFGGPNLYSLEVTTTYKTFVESLEDARDQIADAILKHGWPSGVRRPRELDDEVELTKEDLVAWLEDVFSGYESGHAHVHDVVADTPWVVDLLGQSYDWVVFKDSFPEDCVTWCYVGDDDLEDGMSFYRRNPAGGAPGNRPIFAVKTNFPDADLWVIRKGTPEKIGSVAKTFSPEHIGVQVLATDLVLPDYLYYVLANIHARGFYRERMTGTLRLQHITIDDVKDALRLLRL